MWSAGARLARGLQARPEGSGRGTGRSDRGKIHSEGTGEWACVCTSSPRCSRARTNAQAQAVAQQIGAKSYHECSALQNDGVDVSCRVAGLPRLPADTRHCAEHIRGCNTSQHADSRRSSRRRRPTQCRRAPLVRQASFREGRRRLPLCHLLSPFSFASLLCFSTFSSRTHSHTLLVLIPHILQRLATIHVFRLSLALSLLFTCAKLDAAHAHTRARARNDEHSA